MTSQPERPFGGVEYPARDQTRPPADPYALLDYPESYPPLPPPVYPSYPGPFPGYPVDPYDPYRPVKPAGTNSKAVGSLIASLVGLLCCGLPSIAGIVLGAIAMRETRRTGQDGYTMALVGTLLGALIAAMWLVFWAVRLLGVLIAVKTGPHY